MNNDLISRERNKMKSQNKCYIILSSHSIMLAQRISVVNKLNKYCVEIHNFYNYSWVTTKARLYLFSSFLTVAERLLTNRLLQIIFQLLKTCLLNYFM